jgi:hypothetical protein
MKKGKIYLQWLFFFLFIHDLWCSVRNTSNPHTYSIGLSNMEPIRIIFKNYFSDKRSGWGYHELEGDFEQQWAGLLKDSPNRPIYLKNLLFKQKLSSPIYRSEHCGFTWSDFLLFTDNILKCASFCKYLTSQSPDIFLLNVSKHTFLNSILFSYKICCLL